jgi:signal transduction histidine kinase
MAADSEHERLSAIGLATSVLVHEIANPLNNLFLHAQLLARDLKKEGHPLTERAEKLVAETRRLSTMLEDFRKLGMRRALELEDVDLAQLVEKVAEVELRPIARGIEVRTSIGDAVPAIRAQREKIQRALVHLGKNAIEAMPEGGTLTIAVREHGDSVEVTVEDTGVGISPDIDVFRPFQSTKEDGTGLGLAIVHQIVRAHQGTITYEPARDRGTRFVVTLPIEPSRASTPG